MKDLSSSVVALLVSEACGIGLAPVVNPAHEALTRARRAPVNLRFVVPVRTVSAAPSPKCFGFKRGITWLNAVKDQVAGRGQMVAPDTPRDSSHILDALLNLDGGVKPEMAATDNASYSDMVFGLFKILDYNFSPRFRDLDDQRFWRATMPGVETGTYGAVEDLARNRVNLNKVITHWPDMLKVAGSLVTNQVRAYDLLRMFGREGRPTPLGAAFAEYGRIAKTEHLLRWSTRTSSARSARSSTPLCSGRPVTSTPPSPSSRPRATRSARRTSPGSPPLKHRNLNLLGRYSFTARPRPPAPCARCATRTRPSWTRTTKVWTERSHRVTRAYRVAGCSEIASAGRGADVRLPGMSD
ncbi:Tn3 family transposase [Streptomyces sp. E11-3]